ncbi:MAG: GAF domain-containing protein [Sphingomonas adhaesiva]|uniref:GAF domain-containing protein n=1 Tax=Sphingomonas adhaesiva TaxID=28212 RepID=UPI002FFB7A16
MAVQRFDSAEAVRFWLSERFAVETDGQAILAVVAETLGRFLGISRVAYGEIDPHEDIIHILPDWTDGVASVAGRRPLYRDAELVREYARGRTLIVPDVGDMTLAAEERAWLAQSQTRAFVAVPLIHDGRFVALFAVNHHLPRAWSADEVALVTQTGARLWAALQHARTIAQLRESEEQFRLLAENMPGICWLSDADGLPRWTNRAGKTTYGDVVADPLERVHPDDRAAVLQHQARSLRHGVPFEMTVRMRIADGSYPPMLTRTMPIRDAAGAVTRWCGLQFDLSEQQARSRHDAFSRALADAIRDAAEPAAILDLVADMLKAHLDVARVIYSEAEQGENGPVFNVRRDAADALPDVSGLHHFPPCFDDLFAAYARGETVVSDDFARLGGAINAGLRDFLAAIGVRSGFAVPLVKAGRLDGVLIVQHDTPRRWQRDEIALVEEVAERTWSTLNRARAEASLKARERDQAFLLEWSDAVRGIAGQDAIMNETLAQLGRHLDVGRVTFSEAADRVFTTRWNWCASPRHASLLGLRVSLDAVGSAIEREWLAGEIVRYDDVARDARVGAEDRATYAARGIGAFVSLPLIRDDRVVAILSVQSEGPRVWADREVALMRDAAERTWNALERARAQEALQQRERDQAFLLDWSDAIRRTASADQVLSLTLERLTRYLGGTRTTYSVGTGEPGEFVVIGNWCDGVRSVVGARFSLADVSPSIVDQWLAGHIVRYDDVVGDPRVLPGREAYYAGIEVRAFVTVPLIVDGEMRGSISVQSAQPRVWEESEIRLIRDISERLWIALDRAAAQADLRQRERDQAFLIEWSDAVRDEVGAHAILATTLERVGRYLGVDRGACAEADATGEGLVTISEFLSVPGERYVGRRFAIAGMGERLIADHLTGRPVVMADTSTDPRLDPRHRALFAALNIRASASIPLVRAGRLEAVFSLQQAQPRHWLPSEIRLLRDVADRTWAVLERARSEERLNQSEAQLSAFLQNAPVAMHLKDAAGRYVRINPQFATAVGREYEEVQGLRAEDLFPPAVAATVDALATRAFAGHVAADEFDTGRQGAYQSVLSISFPIGGTTGPAHIGGFTIDLTERKRAEEALARSREALFQAEKLSALGSLLAGVSHELNNPLSIVVAQAVMMERQGKGTELAERAFKIRRAADRCARIVQTFLAMARQKAPERRPVDLGEVAVAALDLTEYGMRSEGIVVRRDFAERLPQIAADADQLHQIIINLLINAQHALAGQDGERCVTIRTARGPEPMTVVLDVADNGPGIPAEVRRRIFEPFFTTKTQGEGTGVGLSFSQGLAEAHGGRLTLLPGDAGATFRLTLPVEPQQTLSLVEPEPVAAAVALSRRALVVDDEAEIAESLADFLSLEGYVCEIAIGGVAARARLAHGDYDLIVSDLRMSDLDGPALYDFVRTARPELAARMAFATGDTLGAAAARFIAEARRPVLEKPFVPEAVRRFLDQMDQA